MKFTCDWTDCKAEAVYGRPEDKHILHNKLCSKHMSPALKEAVESDDEKLAQGWTYIDNLVKCDSCEELYERDDTKLCDVCSESTCDECLDDETLTCEKCMDTAEYRADVLDTIRRT